MKAAKTLAFVLSAVLSGVVLTLFVARFFFESPAATPPSRLSATVHYYDNASVSLKDIHLQLVYFVPKDFRLSIYAAWKKVVEDAGRKVAEFYNSQFEGLVSVTISVYPEVIVGENETAFYNGSDTSSGNPKGLIRIYDELGKRLNREKKSSVYQIIGIVYEGVGASGSGELASFLLSRDYLTRDHISSLYGLSIMAHELGHAFGMPDASEGKDSEAEKNSTIFTSDDIMGTGRFKPLQLTYLSDDIKKHMIRYAKN